MRPPRALTTPCSSRDKDFLPAKRSRHNQPSPWSQRSKDQVARSAICSMPRRGQGSRTRCVSSHTIVRLQGATCPLLLPSTGGRGISTYSTKTPTDEIVTTGRTSRYPHVHDIVRMQDAVCNRSVDSENIAW